MIFPENEKDENSIEQTTAEENLPEAADVSAEPAQDEPAQDEPAPKKRRSFGEWFSDLSKRMREAGFYRPHVLVCACILIFSNVVYLLARLFPAVGEFWSRYPGMALRWLISRLTTWFHFSLIEWIVVSLPVLIIAMLIYINHSSKRANTLREAYRSIIPLICLVCILLSMFFASFGTCYFRNSLSENLGLKDEKVSGQELYDTALIVYEGMQSVIDDVTFQWEGASIMPYSYDELVEKMNAAYVSYCSKVDYITTYYTYPKPIALSEPFTYTHISGVYSFVTGESNININYPDYVIPYTMAHEMAHQRGIAAEDEANFVAYLVCLESDDAYIRYSAYISMYDYLLSALNKADKELYTQFTNKYYPTKVYYEFLSYSVMFAKYSSSKISQISSSLNNTYLGIQGQTAGVASYGLVVDLAVAYYKQK